MDNGKKGGKEKEREQREHGRTREHKLWGVVPPFLRLAWVWLFDGVEK